MEVGSIFMIHHIYQPNPRNSRITFRQKFKLLNESTGSTLLPHMKESFFVLFIEDTWATLYVVP